MSVQPADDADCNRETGCDPVSALLTPKAKDLGGFEVRRVLPALEQRAVGPFVFFDHMGPADFGAGEGIDVRPHPHIGLSTLTWLFEGEIMHRDSLGSAQPIRPGEVNWMTAGRGIVHSERTPDSLRATGHRLQGIQTWHALPEADEETEPRFEHFTAEDIPVVDQGGTRVALIAGSSFGMKSPVTVFSDTLYADVRMEEGASFAVPAAPEERALYIVEGEIEIGGTTFSGHRMLVFREEGAVIVKAKAKTHLMLIGGAPLGHRHVWWNLVSSSKDRIEQAKRDWKEGRFAKVPGDEQEFIPLPD